MDSATYLSKLAACKTANDIEVLAKEVKDAENALRSGSGAEVEAQRAKGLINIHSPQAVEAAEAAAPAALAALQALRQRGELLFDSSSIAPGVCSKKEAAVRMMTDVIGGGLLNRFDNAALWNDLVVAGGAPATALRPHWDGKGEGSLRKMLNDPAGTWGSSDIDLFVISGLEGTKTVLQRLEESLQATLPVDVIAFRSAFAVSFVSQWPWRTVQVVLRAYSGIAQALFGFDVDSSCVAFDGTSFLASARGHLALITGVNRVDIERRSPTYEARLAKYGSRGFGVAVPGFSRAKVDGLIFERPLSACVGLERLLVLEKLRSPAERHAHRELAESQTSLQPGRSRRSRLQRKGKLMKRLGRLLSDDPDLSAQVQSHAESGQSNASDYGTIFLPWSQNWSASSIAQLMFNKDVILNSPWFEPDVTHHRHPAFFGRVADILGDACGSCPELPEEDEKLFIDHNWPFVKGDLRWLSIDPATQRLGSFHPLDAAGWHGSAFGGGSGAEADGVDGLGRTALHRAAFRLDVAEGRSVLSEEGVNVNAVMNDGRTALMVAASLPDSSAFVAMLFEAADVDKILSGAVLKDGAGMTALHYALLFGGDPGTAGLLLQHATNNPEIAAPFSPGVGGGVAHLLTCGLLSARYSKELLQSLLASPLVQVDVWDRRIWTHDGARALTPLMIASQTIGAHQAIHDLLELAGDRVQLNRITGGCYNAITLAATLKIYDNVRVLFEAGARWSPTKADRETYRLELLASLPANERSREHTTKTVKIMSGASPGVSLGGLAWKWPEVAGLASHMSSLQSLGFALSVVTLGLTRAQRKVIQWIKGPEENRDWLVIQEEDRRQLDNVGELVKDQTDGVRVITRWVDLMHRASSYHLPYHSAKHREALKEKPADPAVGEAWQNLTHVGRFAPVSVGLALIWGLLATSVLAVFDCGLAMTHRPISGLVSVLSKFYDGIAGWLSYGEPDTRWFPESGSVALNGKSMDPLARRDARAVARAIWTRGELPSGVFVGFRWVQQARWQDGPSPLALAFIRDSPGVVNKLWTTACEQYISPEPEPAKPSDDETDGGSKPALAGPSNRELMEMTLTAQGQVQALTGLVESELHGGDSDDDFDHDHDPGPVLAKPGGRVDGCRIAPQELLKHEFIFTAGHHGSLIHFAVWHKRIACLQALPRDEVAKHLKQQTRGALSLVPVELAICRNDLAMLKALVDIGGGSLQTCLPASSHGRTVFDNDEVQTEEEAKTMELQVWEEEAVEVDEVVSFKKMKEGARHPTHKAAVVSHEELVRWSPAHLATAAGATQSLSFLKDSGADLLLGDGRLRTVLHCAVGVGRGDVLAWLLSQASDVFRGPVLDALDEDGFSALHYAAGLDDRESVELLLQAGAKFGRESRDGFSAIEIAAGCGLKKALSALISGHKQGGEDDALLLKAFWQAAKRGKTEAGRMLVAAGVKAETRDSLGFDALFYAARNNREDFCVWMLEDVVSGSRLGWEYASVGRTAVEIMGTKAAEGLLSVGSSGRRLFLKALERAVEDRTMTSGLLVEDSAVEPVRGVPHESRFTLGGYVQDIAELARR